MSGQMKVHIIPLKPQKREKRVGIYGRVSTNSVEQLQSLTAQISHFILTKNISRFGRDTVEILDALNQSAKEVWG